jgi:integrase
VRARGIDTPIEIIRKYGVKTVSEILPKHDLISIHVGRKTFTTLSLEKGIPMQEVMSLTNHATFKSFRRYVNVTDQRKQAAMAQAWGEVKENNLKAV